MVPPVLVVNNRFHGVRGAALVAAGLWLAGCAPPGPRSLLQGEKLIKEGRFAEAIPKLKQATTLLPRNAQAWNHLGLAYHGNHQAEPAQRAYQTALALDPRLAAARYNLGCLYLETTNLPAATQELYSYALLQRNSVDARLKLGVAHLRSRRLDDAERSFKEVLELHPRHPEALNNLGVVQYQRRRWQEANNYFNLALVQDPANGPAQLNMAVVNHTALNNRTTALKHYRQYVAVQPRGADTESVDAVARQLDAELNPQIVLRPVVSNTPIAPPVRTSAVAVTRATNPASTLVASARSNPPAAPVLVKSNPPVIAAVPKPVLPAPPPPVTSAPPVIVASATPVIPATEVRDDFVIKPAQELAANNATASLVPPDATTATPTASSIITETPIAESPKAREEPARRGFLSRLNPFGGKSKQPAPAKPVADPKPNPPSLVAQATAPIRVEPKPPPPPPPRYPYQSPATPRTGNRAQAEPALARGVKAHQAGQASLAVQEYQAALRSDPAYFEAYYNLGLAARDAGELGLALAAYEGALAVKSDSADARYNFALALKACGYTQDAADQLARLLQAHPGEVRAHLSLANLCAQQLAKPAEARQHYERVLALNPAHPESSNIRTWLATNP